MFNITLITLYVLSIKLSYGEIKKKERKILNHLKKDGYFVEDLGKVNFFFNFISVLPGLNMYIISLLKDNFESSYYEIIEILKKKEYIIESPALIEVNNELKKLEAYEYDMMKNKDLKCKIKHIEKRKNRPLFSASADFISMGEEEQIEFFRKEREKKEINKLASIEILDKPNIEEAILYLNNMKKFFNLDTDNQKVKRF